MKKLFSVCVCLLVVISCAVVSFAAAPEKDGTYEVSVEMIHKTEEKESMGNKYIAHTALLEIDGKNKFLTVALSSKVMKLEIFYFDDGSIDGDVKNAQQVENVKIGEDTYDVGYRFPIVSDTGVVGVKFSASIMPMSPTARIRIDYDSAVPAKADNDIEVTESEPDTTENIVEQSTPTQVTDQSVQTTAPTQVQSVSTTAVTQQQTTVFEQSMTEVAAVTQRPDSSSPIETINADISIDMDISGWILCAIVLILVVYFIQSVFLDKDSKGRDND